MATATILPMDEKFIDNCDPDDPEYLKDLIRPVEIKEDVKLMQQRRRVTVIKKSKKFRQELEEIIKRQCAKFDISESSASLLSVNYISEQLILAALPRAVTIQKTVAKLNGIAPINDLRETTCNYKRKERQLRCKLAAIHRLINMFKWCDNTQNFVTVRLPTSDNEDNFLLKPSGIFFNDVSASQFISIDVKGNVKDPGSTNFPVDDSNWLFHAAIHSYRRDICCIIHLRTSAAINVSSSGRGILPLSKEAVLLGPVAVLRPDIELTQTSTDEWHILLQNLRNAIMQVMPGDCHVLVLPNQGIVVAGYSVEHAWHLLQQVQSASEIQEALFHLDAEASDEGEEVLEMEEELREEIKAQHQRYVTITTTNNNNKSVKVEELEFEALMRHLDNQGYRTGYLYHNLDIQHNEDEENGSTAKPAGSVPEDRHNVGRYPDVEIPPVCSSLAYSAAQYYEGTLSDDEDATISSAPPITNGYGPPSAMTTSLQQTSTVWFNTPNKYVREESSMKGEDVNTTFEFASLQADAMAQSMHHWVSASAHPPSRTRPHHPITPGAHVSITTVPSSTSAPSTPHKTTPIDPRELKAKQQTLRARYYHDTNTPGPKSNLLEDITWEEARQLRQQGLDKYLGGRQPTSDEPLVTAASKGIVQRNFKNQAIVLENVFKPTNPFDNMTQDDLDKYRQEVERKQHPELFAEPAQPPQEEVVQEIMHSSSQIELESIPLPADLSFRTDPGMTSDSDFPEANETSGAITRSMTAPLSSEGHAANVGATTTDVSGSEAFNDDEKSHGAKDKKKKKLFKNIFKKKKKDHSK